MAPANPQEVHDIAKSAKSAKAIAAADPDKNTVNLPHFRDGLTPLARCIVFNLSGKRSLPLHILFFFL